MVTTKDHHTIPKQVRIAQNKSGSKQVRIFAFSRISPDLDQAAANKSQAAKTSPDLDQAAKTVACPAQRGRRWALRLSLRCCVGSALLMSSYKRLATDMDDTEEAELRRLEGGAAAGTCRRVRQRNAGAARAHETGACTAAGAAAAGGAAFARSGAEGSAFTHATGHAMRPVIGSVEGKVLAPRLVDRTACLVERISEFTWRVAAGEAVAHFLAANGPPEIVSYNWNRVTAPWSCPVAVCREPVVPDPGQRFAHHDFADLLRLTSFGECALRKPGEKQSLVYRLELACSGASHGLPKRAYDPTNCARVCCGALGSTCTCKQKRHQACCVRILITATPALVRQGRFEIKLKGSHVPNGVQPVPPPLNGLRIDPSLQRQLVNLCKSSKQTPTTAVADLVPELKLAQQACITPSTTEGTIGGEASDAPPLNNTRFNPKPSVVAGALKRLRRELRGPAAIGDWERVNKLVREQLIQHNVSSSTPTVHLVHLCLCASVRSPNDSC